jgi:hypothetical protein
MSQAAIEQDWDHVASLAADLHDAHARLVDFVATVLVEGTWQAAGLRSPEHCLTLRAGLSRGQATAIVLLARRQAELPATAAALREGLISLDQAAVVARHTPAAFDETVAELAQHATVSQLQRCVTRYDFTLEPRSHDEHGHLLPAEVDTSDPHHRPEPVEPARLTMGVDPDGRFRLRYEAPADVGALVETALAEAKDHLFHALADATGADGAAADRRALDGDVLDPNRGPTDGGSPRITWADALMLLATRSLDTGTADTPARRSRFRVQVHLDTTGGWLTGRPRIPKGIVDKLTCAGTLTPVWETDGQPVNVGRTQRVVPHRTRIVVLDRDRGCRHPGCSITATGYLEIHHLIHWRDGGPTDLTNLLGLCPFHHDGHHRGEFTITGDPTRPDGLEFHTQHGLLIGPPRRPPSTPIGPAPTTERVTAAAGPATGPALVAATGPRRARERRPRSRLGRDYPAPTGAPLHLRLVDFTPPGATPLRR